MQNNKMAKDRRFFFRRLMNLEVIINNDFVARMLNINHTGCCVKSDEAIKNDRFEINIYPYVESTISAQVVWKQEKLDEKSFVYGLKFIDIYNPESHKTRKMLLLDENVFEEHAKEVCCVIENSVDKKAIINFFLEDVRDTLSNLLDIEELVKDEQNLNPEEFAKINTLLDEIVAIGDLLEIYFNFINPSIMHEIKQRTRILLGDFLYRSQIMRRALEKPRGYTGDYIMAELVYNNVEVSDGFAKYFDRYYLNNVYINAVRLKKDKMQEILSIYFEENRDKNLNVLDLTRNSMRELVDLFSGSSDYNGKLNVFCVNQDEESINFCKEDARKLTGKNSNINFNFICSNILKLKEMSSLENISENSIDLIYCMEIMDYLEDRMLNKVLKDIFALLKKGGKFIVTYKDSDKYNELPLNWFCDWYFIKRTEGQVVGLVTKILGKDNIDIEITRENSGVIFFVTITKL